MDARSKTLETYGSESLKISKRIRRSSLEKIFSSVESVQHSRRNIEIEFVEIIGFAAIRLIL